MTHSDDGGFLGPVRDPSEEESFRHTGESTSLLPAYVDEAINTDLPDDFVPKQPENQGAFTEDSDIRNVLEVPEANLEASPNAAQVTIDAIREDVFSQEGWGIPGSRTAGSAPTTSSSSSSTRQGSLLEVLGQWTAGAGGAIVAVALAVIAALAWVSRDG